MRKKNWAAYADLGGAMTIVGSSMVFGKVITEHFPVFLASGLRFAVASLILLPFVYVREKSSFALSARDVGALLFMAFCGQFVFTVLVLLGLRYTSAVEAGIITATSPAMMVMAAFVLFREKPDRLRGLSVVLVVAGIVCVNGLVGARALSWHAGHITGNLMMVGAVMGEAFFLLMRRRIPLRISNLALTAFLCVAGLILFFPFAVYQAAGFDFSSVPARAWGAILYFGAVFTVLAYLLWFRGVTRVPGAVAGLFTAVMPVSAVVLSVVFLNETFHAHHAAGMGLVLTAIGLGAMKS